MHLCWANIEKDDVWRLSVEGPCLDGARVEALRQALRSTLLTGPQNVVIDLQRIDHLDPLGLAGLAMLAQEFVAPTRVVLAALRPEVQEAALLVHLHDIWVIYEDARSAAFDLSSPVPSS